MTGFSTPSPAPPVEVAADRRAYLIALGGAVAGVSVVTVGLLAGQALGVLLLLLALLLVPLLLLQPMASAVALTVAETANLSGVAGTHGVPAVHLVLIGLGTASVALAVARGTLRLRWSPVFFAGLVLLSAQAVAAVAGQDPAASLALVLEIGRGLILLVLVTTVLADDRQRPRLLAAVFVLTLSALSLLTVVQEFGLHNSSNFWGLANVPLTTELGSATARHAGPQQDVNFWGRVLVLAVPLSLSLAVLTDRLRRCAWLAAGLALLAGIYLTQSRGALLAVLAAVVAWALLSGKRARRLLLAAPLLIAVALVVPGVGSRLQTLSTLETSSVTVRDPSLEGRLAAQRVALRIVREHPLLGVGPANFEEVEPEYLRQLGLSTIVLAPHNEYLEAAAEGGIIGASSLLLFLGMGVFVALRARALSRAGHGRSPPDPIRALAVGVIAALVGWLVASAFLHLATFRSLVLILALGAALDLRAHSAQATAVPEWDRAKPEFALDRVAGSASPSGRGRSVLALACAAAALVPLFLLARSSFVSTTSWRASASAQLVLNKALPNRPSAYELDTLSRDSLLRTFAALAAEERTYGLDSAPAMEGVRHGRARIDVAISPPSTVIALTATSADEGMAARAAVGARDATISRVNALTKLYRLTPVASSSPAHRLGGVNLLRLGALVFLGWDVLGLATLVVQRKVSRPLRQLSSSRSV